ncbi:MAG: hypothetical protein GX359_04735 [Clostridiales bacterium]|nr:hypothetical protein [Clostridiales bacterium]
MLIKLIKKITITLGLLLFFTLIIPLTPYNAQTVKAVSIEKEKSNDYRLNIRSITLVTDKSFTLRVYNLSENAKVSFKSNDSEIASVNDDGRITAKKVGTTAVVATIKDGDNSTSLKCDVTVGPPAFSVRITKSRIILGVNQSDILKVILKPSNTVELAKFSSYNSDIASISVGGRVTAQSKGLTYLFAEIDAKYINGNNKFDVCTLIVTDPDDASALERYLSSNSEMEMLPGFSKALEEFFNGTSEKKAIASSTESGKLVDALDQFLAERYNLDKENNQEPSNEAGNEKREAVSEDKHKI